MKFVYVVEMLRWGNDENHSYVVGVSSTLKAALELGVKHYENRGGKYEPRITAHEVDEGGLGDRMVDRIEHAKELLEEFTKC